MVGAHLLSPSFRNCEGDSTPTMVSLEIASGSSGADFFGGGVTLGIYHHVLSVEEKLFGSLFSSIRGLFQCRVH